MNAAVRSIVVETSGTLESREFVRQLSGHGLRTTVVADTRSAISALSAAASDSSAVCYVHARVAELAPDAGLTVDLFADLRSLASEFPRLVDTLKGLPSPHAVFVGSDAAWGQTANPALASYAAWTFALARNMDLIASGSVLGNAIVGRRLDQPWATRPSADLVSWLLDQPVGGQEFDVSAPRTIGVLRW
ncbi:MAG: hypothetical protein QM750_25830 [Rubrivivax sp.]